MAGIATTLKTATQHMPLNIYSIFVGPPTTGRSQAIKECAISPMASIMAEADSASPVIQKCTLSGQRTSRRQQQRVPFVSRDLRRPVQIAKV